jgi:hypothetical protein
MDFVYHIIYLISLRFLIGGLGFITRFAAVTWIFLRGSPGRPDSGAGDVLLALFRPSLI